jgi:RNA polymerase sigma-32 factor
MKTRAEDHATAAEGLGFYLRDIRAFPMLAPEVEQDLAKRFRRTGDAAAATKLVGSHLRLVVRIAKGYRGYNLPIADLIAEGNVGLTQALQKFDPSRGVRFSTYATWWIRASIQDFVMRSRSLVKTVTTANQKKLFFNLRRLKVERHEIGDGDMAADVARGIAEALSVTEEEVRDMNRRLRAGDQSLNVTGGVDFDTEWQDRLIDEQPDPETRAADQDEMLKRRALLRQSLARLSERERNIVQQRRLREEPITLEILSQHYGISRERVRQIEAQAMHKLQKAMCAAVA